MDTSTYEILKECNSGCRMAVNSIEQLVVYLKNQELQELFSKYKEDYEKMERESIRLSEGKLQEEKFSEKAAETFAWISAEVKMMFNDDTSKIAEMMIDGANMGIKSITEKLNRYPEAEKESISLAKKFEKTCEKLIQDMKKYFTAVVRAMMNLSRANFLYGCHGYNLDVLVRQPIWDLNIDFQCGSGHGVGYLGNVHEPPTGFRWYVVPSKNEHHQLEEGMVITDEPGIYEDGKFGIRIENEFIVRKGELNKYGQFMHFETITFAPIDLDGIDPEEMTKSEREWLNNYHKDVYEKIGPHLTDEEREWLKEYTRAI